MKSLNVKNSKEIKGYEGRYSVDENGSVFSFISQNSGHENPRPKIIKLKPGNNKGYSRVVLLCENGSRKSLFVHKLVMDAFNANNDTQLFINHIDGVKTNNKLNNLEWVTRSENQKHAYRLGLQTPVDNGLKKTISIFKNEVLLDTKVSIRELCRSFNLDRRTVQRTISGIHKHHKGYTFKINETTRKQTAARSSKMV